MPADTSPAPTLDDILRLFQATDRKFQETDRKFQETALKFQETDRKFQQTAREIKRVSTNIGKLGNRLGEFVEEAVRPAAVRLFRECGIDVHEVQQNVVVKRDGEELELDLLVGMIKRRWLLSAKVISVLTMSMPIWHD